MKWKGGSMWEWLDPSAFWITALPLAALVYTFLKSRKDSIYRAYAFSGFDGEIYKQSRKTRQVFRLLFAGSLISMILMVGALARPSQLKTWIKKYAEGIDIAIVLDVSESMEADDLQPTRLVAAKSVIREFISHRPEDRIGMVVFGGEAVMKSPLTRDHDFLLSQVEEIKLRELRQGTAIGSGLINGIARLRRSESKNRVLILLTDGDSNVGSVNPMTAANLARQEGIRIYTIGIGKSDRVVIPIYAYDSEGRKTQVIARVPSYLNPELLSQIAKTTGGKSYMARDNGMLIQFLQEIDKLEKTKAVVLPLSERQELFQIPLLMALGMLLAVYYLGETRYQRVTRKNAA